MMLQNIDCEVLLHYTNLWLNVNMIVMCLYVMYVCMYEDIGVGTGERNKTNLRDKDASHPFHGNFSSSV